MLLLNAVLYKKSQVDYCFPGFVVSYVELKSLGGQKPPSLGMWLVRLGYVRSVCICHKLIPQALLFSVKNYTPKKQQYNRSLLLYKPKQQWCTKS